MMHCCDSITLSLFLCGPMLRVYEDSTCVHGDTVQRLKHWQLKQLIESHGVTTSGKSGRKSGLATCSNVPQRGCLIIVSNGLRVVVRAIGRHGRIWKIGQYWKSGF